jgi:hypothetical protein
MAWHLYTWDSHVTVIYKPAAGLPASDPSLRQVRACGIDLFRLPPK